MSIKFKLTVIAMAIWTFIVYLYHFIQGPLESKIAVNQLDDSVISYALSQNLSQGSMLTWVAVLFIIIIALIWIPPMMHHKQGEK